MASVQGKAADEFLNAYQPYAIDRRMLIEAPQVDAVENSRESKEQKGEVASRIESKGTRERLLNPVVT